MIDAASSSVTATDADVLIVGGGMVGLTLALALAGAGLTAVVIDAQRPEDQIAPAFDGRASAFAAATVRMLKAIGLWPALAPRAQPIEDILVSDGRLGDRFRRGGQSGTWLHFDPRELPASAGEPLGHMVENRDYRAALLDRTRTAAGLKFVAPAAVQEIAYGRALVTARLQDGRRLRGRLCIAADGKDSPTRRAAGLRTLSWAYGQCALVTTVAHALAHGGVAQEYFLPAGPFAVLPLTGRRSSIVWTEQAAGAAALLRLDDAAFARQLGRRLGGYLGEIELVGPRFSYPLALQLAYRYVKPRLALVGDAAHVVHPIAGQGLNMGLRDCAALAEVLADAKRLGLDLGAGDVLERYQRWRRLDNVSLAAITDGLNRLFANDWTPLRRARDLGLGLVNRAAPLKRFFMRHAMGAVGDLPRLLRGEAL